MYIEMAQIAHFCFLFSRTNKQQKATQRLTMVSVKCVLVCCLLAWPRLSTHPWCVLCVCSVSVSVSLSTSTSRPLSTSTSLSRPLSTSTSLDLDLSRPLSLSLSFDLSHCAFCVLQIQFVLMFSRQGKLRLQKWFGAASQVSTVCMCKWFTMKRSPV